MEFQCRISSISSVPVYVNRELRAEFSGLPLKAPPLDTSWLCLFAPERRNFAARVATGTSRPRQTTNQMAHKFGVAVAV